MYMYNVHVHVTVHVHVHVTVQSSSNPIVILYTCASAFCSALLLVTFLASGNEYILRAVMHHMTSVVNPCLCVWVFSYINLSYLYTCMCLEANGLALLSACRGYTYIPSALSHWWNHLGL